MSEAIDLSKISPSEVQLNQIKINAILGEGHFVLIGLHAGVICGFSGPEAVDIIGKSLEDIKREVSRASNQPQPNIQ